MKNYFETAREVDPQQDIESGKESKISPFYQRGLGLKNEVRGILKQEYFSALVAHLRATEYRLHAAGVTIHLAREFGFCYGVDRAVDYAYQTRQKFPDRHIFLTGEIIHNPHVNHRLLDIGVEFLSGQYSNGKTHADLRPEDVVILPAFGVSVQEFQTLKRRGCILVDTTCGSVLNVWKRVSFYAKNGYTSIIHGKFFHEETIATSSQALQYPDGKYLIVRNLGETERVCEHILNGGDREAFSASFRQATSPHFDPDTDLSKVGVANQTTMLSSESLAIADLLRKAMVEKYGAESLDSHYQTFDTICSATQDRQDAVLELVENHRLDLMLVVGGFNSSNTNHLAEISSKYTTTYHIDDPACILQDGQIRHKRIGSQDIAVCKDWLPPDEIVLGITAGASTPNNKIGEVIERVMRLRGVDVQEIV
ncbi:MAG: 4-hydroxy-3-methylbut-2-enyl diphosphate reductase [bacterium]